MQKDKGGGITTWSAEALLLAEFDRQYISDQREMRVLSTTLSFFSSAYTRVTWDAAPLCSAFFSYFSF